MPVLAEADRILYERVADPGVSKLFNAISAGEESSLIGYWLKIDDLNPW